jgi:hypothetical protein
VNSVQLALLCGVSVGILIGSVVATMLFGHYVGLRDNAALENGWLHVDDQLFRVVDPDADVKGVP